MTVWVLLEKNMRFDSVRIQGVYASPESAADTMESLMTLNAAEKGYKIEEQQVRF